MSLLIVLLLPFIGSLIVGLLPASRRQAVAWVSGLLTAVGLLIVLSAYPAIAAGEVLTFKVPWMSSLGVDFALRLDGFAWLFCLLVLGIGLLVVLYAHYYMSPQDPVPRFFGFLLVFMGAMVGIRYLL